MRSTMRNLLLLFASAFFLTTAGLQAQTCTPDQFALFLGIPGVYPNPIQTSNLANGSVGTAYTDRITFVTPADTTIDLSSLLPFPIPPVTVSIDYQKVNSVTGLPPGVTYACNIASCIFPGDSSGCMGLGGIPTAGGQFTASVSSVLGFTVPNSVPIIGGSVQEIPVPGLNWTIDISGGTGINDVNEGGFGIVGNSPNPFQGNTTVQFQSTRPGTVQLEVRDLTGRMVIQGNHRMAVGENSIVVDASTLSPGVYLYTLSNGKMAQTRKMVVSE